jgi:AraC family transcriptional regulator
MHTERNQNNRGLPPGQLHGQNLRTRNVAGFTLTETSYLPGFQVRRHSHELSQLCFVGKGSFSESYGRKSREVKPLTLIARPCGEAHAHRFHNAGARCLIIEIGNESLRRIREYSTVLEDSAEVQSGVVAWLASRLFKEFHGEDEASSLAIEGLTLEMLSEVSRRPVRVSKSTPPRWLEPAKEFLHSHFSQTITMSEVARAAGAHPTHLARVFRQYYHCTMGEYVRRLRIEFACREASLTDATLMEIALAAGFYDQSHFSRTFKQIMGLTPSQYRAAFRSR